MNSKWILIISLIAFWSAAFCAEMSPVGISDDLNFKLEVSDEQKRQIASDEPEQFELEEGVQLEEGEELEINGPRGLASEKKENTNQPKVKYWAY